MASPRTRVVELDVSNGDVLGYTHVCHECDGDGVLFTAYRTPNGLIIDLRLGQLRLDPQPVDTPEDVQRG